jgi:hypothetical protein
MGNGVNSGTHVSVIVKLVVAFHLVAIVSWSLPNPANAILNRRVAARGNEVILLANHDRLKQFKPMRAYLIFFGTWQYWDMFAPNPSSVDLWGDAEVERADGKIEVYRYPRVYDFPIPKKYVMERYRKFFERAGTEEYAYLWPTFSAHVARMHDTDPNNRPVKIRIRRHKEVLPRFGEDGSAGYSTEMFFEYEVAPSDLVRKEGLP